MNIAFFLTPKQEVVTLEETFTIGQTMDVMTKYRYTSVPVLDEDGYFVDALSEGDILWYLKDKSGSNLLDIEHKKIGRIKRHYTVEAVSISASIDSLIELAAIQAFVPVVDDQNVFIGIIKRSDIINYCMSRISKEKKVLVS